MEWFTRLDLYQLLQHQPHMGSNPITHVDSSKVQGEQSDSITERGEVRGTCFLLKSYLK